MAKHSDKLKPLKGEQWNYSDGYRGDHDIAWKLALVRRAGRPVELYATVCGVCGQWWGWSIYFGQVQRTKKAMARIGCPRCKTRGKRKKQKRLREAIAS